MTMKEIKIKDRTPGLVQQLLRVWEKSVRETHLFFSDAEIKKIKEYVPDALTAVPILIVETDPAGDPVAFMGIDGHKLEMLFISPESVDLLFDTVYNVMGPALDDNGRNAVEHLREIYPQYIFFATLIYCFIYGTILSAILSARIPSKDPFAGYRQ